MKYVFVLVLFSAMVLGCHTTKNTSSVKPRPIIEKTDDSTQYELIIIDSQFETWYLINFSPTLDRSNGYYRAMNQFAVSRWNSYFSSGRYFRIIENYLDYDYNIDYGIDVNRKLYWYFKFVQERFHISLLK
jgi:hypothetical protein